MDPLRISTEHHVVLPDSRFFDAVPYDRNDGFPAGRKVQVQTILLDHTFGDPQRPTVQIPYAKTYLQDGGFSVQHWNGGRIRWDDIPLDVRQAIARQIGAAEARKWRNA